MMEERQRLSGAGRTRSISIYPAHVRKSKTIFALNIEMVNQKHGNMLYQQQSGIKVISLKSKDLKDGVKHDKSSR